MFDSIVEPQRPVLRTKRGGRVPISLGEHDRMTAPFNLRSDEPGDDDAGHRQGDADLEAAEGTDGYGRPNDGRFRSARRSGGGRHRR